MFLNRKTMIYFAPHQDDELLTMGVDILASLRQHHDVHVVLCTDGSKSGVKKVLHNGKGCTKHEGLHNYDLTEEEFIQARDREFRDSCLALGIKSYNIHIPGKRSVDGSLTAGEAQRIIKNFLAICGRSAIVCTTAPTNGPSQHPDHSALGWAANSLLNQGIIREVRFFVEPYHFSQIVENPRMIPVEPTIKKASPQAQEKIKKAISAYSYWNPSEGRYAVGYHSVSTEFDDCLKDPVSYYYTRWNEKSMTRLERLNFQHKKWQKLYKQKQLFYSSTHCGQPELGEWKLVSIQAHDTEGYKAFCEKYGVKLTDKNLQRIADGSSFWCLVSNEDTVLSSGWMAYRHKFYIGETDFGFDMAESKSAILFNFSTNEAYRGQGLYGLLLQSIVYNAEEPERFLIYTSPDNTSSAKGILKAGFTLDGAKSASDNSMQEYLTKAGFTSITRKYQMRGFRIMP